MRICIRSILSFFSIITIVSSLTCNRCITKKIFDVEQPCSTCEGTQCYVLEYNYKFPILAYAKAYEMDCIFSNSVKFPVGCRTNKDGQRLCICDDKDKCNTEQYPGLGSNTILSNFACNFQDYAGNGSCAGNRCVTKISTMLPLSAGCQDNVGTMTVPTLSSFDIMGYPEGIFIPSNMCVYFKFSDYSSSVSCFFNRRIEAMDFDIPRNITCVTEFPFSNSETTCKSNFCFAARTSDNAVYYGCFSYGKSEIYSLKTGLFSIASTKLFLCNTELCNKYIDPDGKTRKPTDFSNKGPTGSLGGAINCSCPTGEKAASHTENFIMTLSLIFYILLI